MPPNETSKDKPLKQKDVNRHYEKFMNDIRDMTSQGDVFIISAEMHGQPFIQLTNKPLLDAVQMGIIDNYAIEESKSYSFMQELKTKEITDGYGYLTNNFSQQYILPREAYDLGIQPIPLDKGMYNYRELVPTLHAKYFPVKDESLTPEENEEAKRAGWEEFTKIFPTETSQELFISKVNSWMADPGNYEQLKSRNVETGKEGAKLEGSTFYEAGGHHAFGLYNDANLQERYKGNIVVINTLSIIPEETRNAYNNSLIEQTELKYDRAEPIVKIGPMPLAKEIDENHNRLIDEDIEATKWIAGEAGNYDQAIYNHKPIFNEKTIMDLMNNGYLEVLEGTKTHKELFEMLDIARDKYIQKYGEELKAEGYNIDLPKTERKWFKDADPNELGSDSYEPIENIEIENLSPEAFEKSDKKTASLTTKYNFEQEGSLPISLQYEVDELNIVSVATIPNFVVQIDPNSEPKVSSLPFEFGDNNNYIKLGGGLDLTNFNPIITSIGQKELPKNMELRATTNIGLEKNPDIDLQLDILKNFELKGGQTLSAGVTGGLGAPNIGIEGSGVNASAGITTRLTF